MKQILTILILLFVSLQGLSQKTNKAKMQATYNAIKAAGIVQPDMVMAQCIQETGWLNCNNCCLRYHNLFGFFKRNMKCMKFDQMKNASNTIRNGRINDIPNGSKKIPKALITTS